MGSAHMLARAGDGAPRADFVDLIPQAPYALYSLDGEGRIIRANDRLLTWLGCKADDVLCKARITDFYDDEGKATFASHFPRFLQDGHVENLSFALYSREGVRRQVSMSASTQHAANGEFLCTRSVMVDVTGRDSLADRELAARTRELLLAQEDLKSISYSLSHDLRAPLRAINSLAAILIEDHGQELSPLAQELLGRIRGAGRRMGRLLDALLLLIRLETSRPPTEVFAHEPLVEDALQELLAGSTRALPRIILRPLPKSTGHPSLVRQVWSQLLSNALKYTRGDGEVEIGCDGSASVPVFFVRDTGCGFDMRNVNRLFSAFEQPPSDDPAPGIGIGLAVVRHVVARHGGRVWATSAVGQGSTFFFTLEPDPAESA